MSATEFTFSEAEFRDATGTALSDWACQCHSASLTLVKSGVFGEARVARGSCRGVPGQHSWVVLGNDCYDKNATVVDPTLWSYDESVSTIWVGKATERPHVPHGSGSIWQWGRPDDPVGPVIKLDTTGLSREALLFLDLLGPLDLAGWRMLAHAPVEDWPSGEILKKMNRDDRISPFIPIDILGMTTDLNPGGLYLREENVA